MNIYRPGDAMHILHVVPAVDATPASGFVYYPRYQVGDEHALSSQAEQFIKDEFVAMAEERGISVNVVVVKDSPRHDHVGWAVCEHADELQASPLVLYAHHRSIFEELMLGSSVTKFVARNCKRPVLLVNPQHSQLQ